MTESKDLLVTAITFHDHPLRFITGTFQGCPGPPRVEGSAIVVTELDEEVVTFMDAAQHPVPQPLGDKGAAAPSTQCMVLNSDACGVKKLIKESTPAPLAIVAPTCAILHGGVTNQKKHGIALFPAAA